MQKLKGPWFHRLLIHIFTVVLAVLVFWVLGFLVEDVESIQGPRYPDVEKQFVDQALVEKEKTLSDDMADLDRTISNKSEEMRIVSDSSQNLQKTMEQLMELQKITVQKSPALSGQDQASLSETLSRFLRSQEKYQELNAQLSKLADRRRALESEKVDVTKKIQAQRDPARKEFERLREKHDLRLAALQLLLLLPLLAAGAFLVLKKRGSVYFPLFLGYGSAVLVKVALVIHRYFPSRYFRYVLALGLLLAVARILVHFIRIVAFPKAQWLTRQYREAYERFLCPICEYPIRTGPRKYLYWTRRTVNRIPLSGEAKEEGPYSCPACGTVLFEKCPECANIRHSLLPFCQHCNAPKETGDGAKEGGRG